MKTEKIPLIGTATPAEIEAWKKQYKLGFYHVANSTHIAYFQNPDLDHVNCAIAKASDTAVLDMYLECATITKIGGSDEMINNATFFLGVRSRIKEKMEGEQTELVNY